MSARPRRGRADKFANPTNTYQREQHALKVQAGFVARACPDCLLLRWYSREELRDGAQMCGVCAQHGAPTHRHDAVHGLRPDQETKRRQMEAGG